MYTKYVIPFCLQRLIETLLPSVNVQEDTDTDTVQMHEAANTSVHVKRRLFFYQILTRVTIPNHLQ